MEIGLNAAGRIHLSALRLVNARYPREMLQQVITVSLETMKIVNSLPKLDID